MNIADKVCVVTGGASGIGAALARRFAAAGARAVVVADLNGEGAKAVAAGIGGLGLAVDVAREEEVAGLVARAEAEFGALDLMCGNAGVVVRDPDPANVASAPTEGWTRSWEINVMAHVFAARHAVPGMIARGGGWFLNTVSAAGLLTQLGAASYAVTKHAAVGFAEILAITHREHGIGVSVLCPQAVATPLLAGARGAQSVDGVLTPEAVAEAAVEGLAEERFLILPHPQVATYMQRKTSDYDRWLKGMVRLKTQLAGQG
jgi:NAD(P)-dependent dehydrogenase (short-subunit alcohol dehydrogenase family)